MQQSLKQRIRLQFGSDRICPKLQLMEEGKMTDQIGGWSNGLKALVAGYLIVKLRASLSLPHTNPVLTGGTNTPAQSAHTAFYNGIASKMFSKAPNLLSNHGKWAVSINSQPDEIDVLAFSGEPLQPEVLWAKLIELLNNDDHWNGKGNWTSSERDDEVSSLMAARLPDPHMEPVPSILIDDFRDLKSNYLRGQKFVFHPNRDFRSLTAYASKLNSLSGVKLNFSFDTKLGFEPPECAGYANQFDLTPLLAELRRTPSVLTICAASDSCVGVKLEFKRLRGKESEALGSYRFEIMGTTPGKYAIPLPDSWREMNELVLLIERTGVIQERGWIFLSRMSLD